MTMQWNYKMLEELTKGPKFQGELLALGWEVAEVAAELAPKEFGWGAKSIRAEFYSDGPNGVNEVRVSWDRDHFYMGFAEFGTVKQNATPFLRPAAEMFQ